MKKNKRNKLTGKQTNKQKEDFEFINYKMVETLNHFF